MAVWRRHNRTIDFLHGNIVIIITNLSLMFCDISLECVLMLFQRRVTSLIMFTPTLILVFRQVKPTLILIFTVICVLYASLHLGHTYWQVLRRITNETVSVCAREGEVVCIVGHIILSPKYVTDMCHPSNKMCSNACAFCHQQVNDWQKKKKIKCSHYPPCTHTFFFFFFFLIMELDLQTAGSASSSW